MRRNPVLGELLSTLMALAAVSAYMQIRDPLSPARLWISGQLDRVRDRITLERSIHQRVDDLISSVQKERAS